MIPALSGSTLVTLTLAHSQFSKDSSRNRKGVMKESTLCGRPVRRITFPVFGNIKIRTIVTMCYFGFDSVKAQNSDPLEI